MYDDVLVPTDGSEGAQQAAEHALGLAKQYDAAIHVLYVVEPVYTVEAGTDKIIEAMHAEGKRAVAGLAEQAESKGLRTFTDIRMGTPHREILAYTEENGIDLIVMGTHGRTGIQRYLLGSVTEKVVRLSDVPVLTVRQERPSE